MQISNVTRPGAFHLLDAIIYMKISSATYSKAVPVRLGIALKRPSDT
jgi:hypothetical protein